MRGVAACLAYQSQVAFMQRAHGGHQRHFAIAAQAIDCTAQWIKTFDGLHAACPLR